MYQFLISYFVLTAKSITQWFIILCLIATTLVLQSVDFRLSHTWAALSLAISADNAIAATLPANVADNPNGKHLITAATISGRVFFDNNRNGRQEGNEPGVPNVNVSYSGATAPPPPIVNEDGTVSAVGGAVFVGETTTDENGNYVLEGLLDGPDITYDGISFSNLPDGYQFTLTDAGDDDTIDSDPDSNGNTPAFQLMPGETITNVDAGLVAVSGGSVSGRVFFDNNRNGLQDNDELGVPNVSVFYSGSVVGNTVTVNEDGSVSAVGGAASASETLTDENGNYRFEEFPNLSDPTFYYDIYGITFSNLPADYQFTVTDAGDDDTIDSDSNSAGSTPRFQLMPGESKNAIDAGLITATTVKGRVFFDNNENGLQDPGESGVPDVTIFYDGSVAGSTVTINEDGSVSAVGGGTFAGETTTDPEGNYRLDGFSGGPTDTSTYNIARIRFSNFPAGYRLTMTDAGNDDALDSDPNGVGEISGFQLTAGEIINNIDAGIVAVPLGDVNCDGIVNAVDGLFILQYDVGTRTAGFSCPLGRGGSQLYITRSDTNQDSLTNSVDALFILQCDIGRDNAFCPAGQTLYVGPEQVDCVGIVPRQCLLAKENLEDEYTFFFDTIAGFEWEAGFEYQLLVNIEEIANPPADGSSRRYTLVEVVSKTPVDR